MAKKNTASKASKKKENNFKTEKVENVKETEIKEDLKDIKVDASTVDDSEKTSEEEIIVDPIIEELTEEDKVVIKEPIESNIVSNDQEEQYPTEDVSVTNNEEETPYYSVDISLKTKEETEEEFIIRAKKEGIGKFISKTELENNPLIKDGFLIVEKKEKYNSKPLPVNVKINIIDEVKELRVFADEILTIADNQFLKGSDIIDYLFLGKSWLGKLLSHLGAENPYKNEDKIKTRRDIPATADTYSVVDFNKEIYKFNLKNNLDKIIELRAAAERLIGRIENISFEKEDVSDIRLASICKTNAYSNLSEAKFLLGRELSKLKIN